MLYHKHDCKSRLNVLLNIEKNTIAVYFVSILTSLQGNNIQRYCTPKHPKGYLLYNCFGQYVLLKNNFFILKLANQHNYLDNALAYIK